MKALRRSGLLCLSLGLAACEGGRSPRAIDSSAIRAARAADSAARAASPTRNWNPSAGPVLLVAANSPAEAFVIPPDSANAAEQLARVPRPAVATLLGRDGTVQTADLPRVVDTSDCAVAALTGAPPPRTWSVGFIGGVVAPVAMDSLGSLSPTDSLSLVSGLSSLASTLPDDSAGRFPGLPFTVRSIGRFAIADGSQVAAATLTRQINQEATPLQERTLLVSERAPGDTALMLKYSERSYGNEETIETREVLAAILIGSPRTPALIISHDFGDAVSYGLVVRAPDGAWRSHWLSGRQRCGS